MKNRYAKHLLSACGKIATIAPVLLAALVTVACSGGVST